MLSPGADPEVVTRGHEGGQEVWHKRKVIGEPFEERGHEAWLAIFKRLWLLRGQVPVWIQQSAHRQERGGSRGKVCMRENSRTHVLSGCTCRCFLPSQRAHRHRHTLLNVQLLAAILDAVEKV